MNIDRYCINLTWDTWYWKNQWPWIVQSAIPPSGTTDTTSGRVELACLTSFFVLQGFIAQLAMLEPWFKRFEHDLASFRWSIYRFCRKQKASRSDWTSFVDGTFLEISGQTFQVQRHPLSHQKVTDLADPRRISCGTPKLGRSRILVRSFLSRIWDHHGALSPWWMTLCPGIVGSSNRHKNKRTNKNHGERWWKWMEIRRRCPLPYHPVGCWSALRGAQRHRWSRRSCWSRWSQSQRRCRSQNRSPMRWASEAFSWATLVHSSVNQDVLIDYNKIKISER